MCVPPHLLNPLWPPAPPPMGLGEAGSAAAAPGAVPAPCRDQERPLPAARPRRTPPPSPRLGALPRSPPRPSLLASGRGKKKKLTSAVVSRHLPAPAPPLPSVGITPPFYLSITNCLLFCLTRTLSNNNKRQILLLCVTKTPFFFFSVELYSWSWQSERSLCVYFSRCLSLLSE